jgi:hypothetical protein
LKKSVFDEMSPVDAAEIVGPEHTTAALLKNPLPFGAIPPSWYSGDA